MGSVSKKATYMYSLYAPWIATYTHILLSIGARLRLLTVDLMQDWRLQYITVISTQKIQYEWTRQLEICYNDDICITSKVYAVINCWTRLDL